MVRVPARLLPMPIDPVLAFLTPEETAAAAAGPDLTRYVLVCLGILALVLGLAWAFRRFVADSVRRHAAKRSLQVTDVLPLGGRRRLLVVRCFDRNFLIGLGEKEITNIAELEKDEAVQAAPKAAPAPSEERSQETAPAPRPETVPPTPSREKVQPLPPGVKPFPVSLAEELRASQPGPTGRRRRRTVERWKRGEGIVG